MTAALDQAALDRLFVQARTQNGWLPTPVSDVELRRIYDIMKMGPTSANSCPARILFVRTPEAKARLLPALSPGNVDKTKQAPVTAIIGYDTRFYEWMPKKLFTHRPDMAERSWPFATARYRARTSCWPRARSGWTSAACRASTTRKWTPSSFRTAA